MEINQYDTVLEITGTNRGISKKKFYQDNSSLNYLFLQNDKKWNSFLSLNILILKPSTLYKPST